MSKNSLFCPKKESSITQKVLIEIFFNVISHLIFMIWLDLHVEPAPDTGTPSVEAHWGAVGKFNEGFEKVLLVFYQYHPRHNLL